MIIDVATLTFAGALMAFASSLFLLMHWWHAREDRAALSWGTANFGIAVGITMLALQFDGPDGLGRIVGPIMIGVGSAEIWAASRIFRRGRVERRPMIVGLAIWLACIFLAGAMSAIRFAWVLNLLCCGACYLAAAIEFWRVRAESSRARVTMIALLCAEAAAMLLAAVNPALIQAFSALPVVDWFGVIHFVGLIFSGGAAISLITMLKDRSAAKHKAAALVDPLTGLANRRAITEFLERAFESSSADGAPISVLAFDLDKFKNINDTFGHPTGDEILRIFADALSSAAGKNDIAGRIGGEEFVLALAGCDIETALAVAGGVRTAFQDNARFVQGNCINATVSVGVATAPDHGTGLAEIFASADIALYRAKSLGRNRVALAVANRKGALSSTLARFA
jgi:diguanylate cyclase (GGDEF)-like protein